MNVLFSINRKNVLLVVGVLLAVFIIIGAAGIAVWEYTNSDSFCTYTCHSVHPENTYAHRTSRHARVTCTECHMGRISVFRAMAVKTTHAAHAWSMVTGYDRPLSSPSMKSSRDSCENCHSEQPHQNNYVRSFVTYDSDQASTEMRTYLIMNNTGRVYRKDAEGGIRWHAENMVRFIATDPRKQKIPWVEVTLADGSTEIYRDSGEPLPEEGISGLKRHVMDCLDCHNRIGHAFPNPEVEVDNAIASGRLDRTFPFIKARVAALFSREFSDEEEALRIVDDAWGQYRRDFPGLAEKYPEAYARAQRYMKERQSLVSDLMIRSRFKGIGISWRSFPDNIGHRDFRGCFRCHDGKHLSDSGKPIRRNCTLCHNVPAEVREGGPPPRFMSPLSYQKPSGHNDPGFMKTHKEKPDFACSECHGSLKYGEGNSSFCANRACHFRDWPG